MPAVNGTVLLKRDQYSITEVVENNVDEGILILARDMQI